MNFNEFGFKGIDGFDSFNIRNFLPFEPQNYRFSSIKQQLTLNRKGSKAELYPCPTLIAPWLNIFTEVHLKEEPEKWTNSSHKEKWKEKERKKCFIHIIDRLI